MRPTPATTPTHPAPCALALLALMSAPVLAQHEGDIIIRQHGSPNRIQTGAAVVGTPGVVEFPVRVFPAAFGEQPNFTNDPGFDSGSNAFPPSSQIGLDIADALRKWDGQNFDTIPPEQIEIRFGPFGPATTPTIPSVVPGLAATVSAGGEYHRHFGFTLTQPASDGAYLLNLVLWSSDPAIADSDPFWIVFRQGPNLAEFDAAFTWAQANLAGPTPNPCPPDLTGSAIAGQPGYGVPNGVLNNDDFFYYLAQFAAGNLAEADLTTGAVPATPGYGVPNGVLNNDDFFYYLGLFAQGC